MTIRTRHHHAKGMLPEPGRHHSGYRRYDAPAVVELTRIRTLADAGVQLSRVRELLVAGEDEFAAAVKDIDRRLRADIRERQRHRERIAQLAAGDSLGLPPEAVAYLDRMRELGFQERLIEIERDSWIPIAGQIPEKASTLMTVKRVPNPTISPRSLTDSADRSTRPSVLPTTAVLRSIERSSRQSTAAPSMLGKPAKPLTNLTASPRAETSLARVKR